MAKTWVVAPGQTVSSEEQAELVQLQGEIDRIERLGDSSACRLCGRSGYLTAEHAPSKKAGNVGEMLRGTIDEHATIEAGEIKFKNERVHGATFLTLCAECNNQTGSWYNPAYVRFARECSAVARPEHAGQDVPMTVAIHRQRIAKQAATSLIATTQAGLTNRYPELRTLLLQRENHGPLPDALKLWLFLKVNAHPIGMYTGLMVALERARKRGQIVAGFSFWPLGWILTIGDLGQLDGAADVSSWVQLAYEDRRSTAIALPAQFAHEYPGDFRPPHEYAGGKWVARGDG